jgi:hypothetical protein
MRRLEERSDGKKARFSDTRTPFAGRRNQARWIHSQRSQTCCCAGAARNCRKRRLQSLSAARTASVRWPVRHRPGRCRLTYSGRCLPQVFGQGFLLMAFSCSTVPLSYGASLACIQGQYDVYIWRSLPFASTPWLFRLFGMPCAG